MKAVGRCFWAIAVLLMAEPELAAKPSKKDISNCADDDVETAVAGCTARRLRQAQRSKRLWDCPAAR